MVILTLITTIALQTYSMMPANIRASWYTSFVCFVYSRLSNFSAIRRLSPLPWLGCKFRPMLGAQGLWAGRDLYRATPTATRDLGLYGLIRKTGTHVPQWGSNPQLKDHQIFEVDALTTAPRGRSGIHVNMSADLMLFLTVFIEICWSFFYACIYIVPLHD
jgi:hypothetical protein